MSSDVKNQYYYQVLTDVKDYQLTFPDYVQSVSLTQNNFGNFADLSVSGKGIGYDLQMLYSSDPSSSTFSGVVSKGEYSGSTVTITTSKTWSFYTKVPDGGTKIHAELKLKNSGLFSALSFVSDDSIKFGLQQALDKVGDRAKVMQQQNPSTTQLISTTPTQTTTTPTISPTQTTPPVTTSVPVPTPTPAPTPKPIPIPTPVPTPISPPPTPTSTSTPTPAPISPQPTPQTLISITVKTDKNSYKSGDSIIVSGQIEGTNGVNAVQFWIFSPNNKHIFFNQSFMPNPDGSFSKLISTSGSIWNETGLYTIHVQYPNFVHFADTKFYFDSTIPAPTTPQPTQSSTVSIVNTSFKVNPNTKQSIPFILSCSARVTGTISVDGNNLDVSIMDQDNFQKYQNDGYFHDIKYYNLGRATGIFDLQLTSGSYYIVLSNTSYPTRNVDLQASYTCN